MSTREEIEAAAATLPTQQQQELLLFFARRLCAAGALPEPRLFSAEQLQAWVDKDEEDLRRLRAGQ